MVGFSESNEYKNKTRALVNVVTMYVAMVRKVPTQAQIDANLATPPASLATTLMNDAGYDRRFNTVAYPAITSASPLPQASKGKAYTTTLSRYGGPPPVTWKVVSGALPTGLALSSAGAITGTPTKTGTFSFTVQLADVRTRPVNKAFQLTVVA